MPLPQLLLQVAARGAALLILTALAGVLFRRSSAATRHLIWTGGLAASLIAPLIPAPHPVLPLLPALPTVSPAADGPAFDNTGTASTDEPAAERAAGWDGFLPDRSLDPAPVAPDPRPVVPAHTGLDWPRLLALVWATGLVVAGLRLLAGRIAVARLARRAVPVVAPEWRETIRWVLAMQPLRRPLRFLESAEVVTPCTWGTLRPTVLLPAEGAGWSAEERRQVVVHELAHVRRFDCATQRIAGLAAALHWFNPLAWHALRSSRVAREQACDDAVLAAGGTASTYAGLLLAAAAPPGGPWMPAEALAMARRSQIGDRLLAVLDPARRREPVDRRAVGWISATALAVAIPVAAVGSRPAERAQLPTAATAAPTVEPAATPPRAAAITPSVPTRPSAIRATGPTICAPGPDGSNRTAYLNSSVSVSGEGSANDGRGNYMVAWTGPNCTLAIRVRGKVTFNDAEDDVATLSGGGRFEIEHEDGATTRTYLVTNRDGQMQRRYRVNDEDAPLDAEALKWRAALVLEFIRRSGYDAEARVARIRKQGGIDAVVQEISALRSDGARSRYLKIALQDPGTTAADAARLLALSQGIGSDGDRSMVLGATPIQLLADKSVQRAYADAAKGIESDGDLSSVLIRALRSGKLSAGSCEWVLGLAGDIESDGDRSNVLVTATEALEWNSSCVRRALELTRAINSDGDKSRTLVRFLQRHGLPGDLVPVFFQTTATIDSDGDHSQVLHRVIDLDSPSDAVVEGLLEDSRGISSDGDRASVLIAAARRGLVRSEKLRAAYLASARGIDSKGDRESALRALARS